LQNLFSPQHHEWLRTHEWTRTPHLAQEQGTHQPVHLPWLKYFEHNKTLVKKRCSATLYYWRSSLEHSTIQVFCCILWKVAGFLLIFFTWTFEKFERNGQNLPNFKKNKNSNHQISTISSSR
jgi:hypothetical protein